MRVIVVLRDGMTLLDWQTPGAVPRRVLDAGRWRQRGPVRARSTSACLTDDEPGARASRTAAASPSRRRRPRRGDDGLAAARRGRGRTGRAAGIADAGARFARCDGLWTDEPGRAVMLVTADCLPIAVWRARTERRRWPCCTRAGAACSAGIVEAGCGALGTGLLAAAVGPGIGPCCYEVGDEVAAPFRERFGDDVVAGRHLDLRERGRARAARGGLRLGRAGRPLHVLRGEALLLPPPRQRPHRPAGDRCLLIG